VHFDTSGALNVDALLLLLRWDEYGLHKKRDGIHEDELVFLHPVEYVGPVVHCVVSHVRKIDTKFSC
jgi:hypothetical protein